MSSRLCSVILLPRGQVKKLSAPEYRGWKKGKRRHHTPSDGIRQQSPQWMEAPLGAGSVAQEKTSAGHTAVTLRTR